MTHPSPKRNIVPKAVLMRSCLVSLTTARPVNNAQPRSTVNSARPMTNGVNIVKDKNVDTARPKAVVNTAKPKAVLNAVKGNQGNPQQDLEEKGVIDSGCSRHMTRNMSYVTDFKEIDRGYVAFEGNPKGRKITGSGTIKTVPRKNNMYSVDLKNIVPKGGLTCLFVKATSDESKLWHRRLGHINFKTMNKLVMRNIVRGLPLKLFENDQTYVACQKGKQHRASCKSKIVSSISQPLHMLHMDLFGLTFVKSLMKKMYCLVVTDDYSRFSWVFFLATKDETSGILKSFITGVENLIDQRVKVIRCDNGTEFKNKEMNQFCERKGIKREFSVARTPQQNGVAERKNRTLIEAARTMLADSKLPTTFWAEAVNTACYVQNRVLVTKPHNKTPYELFLGRKPALGFMRPFGCPVIILNTINHLGKFDGKADEGLFVGYSINSKHLEYSTVEIGLVGRGTCMSKLSENIPNIAGSRPNWLFDIHALTKSMNYKPVIAGNQSNGIAGTKACDNADSEWSDQEKEDNVNNTNNVNATSTNEVNVVGAKTSIELLDDPDTPELEDIVYSDDDGDMDIKSAFLYGKIEEEVYVCQPTGFEDPDFPDIVYKVEKAIYGLHQAPKAWYETLSTYLLDNGFHRGKIDKALFIRRDKGDILLVQVYVDDIIFGSTKKSLCTKFEKMMHKNFQISSIVLLMSCQQAHLETQKLGSKDDDVCACARYQVNPKVSHLHAVKRIFRYLKGQPKLGLWYPKDLPFDLVAYTDSDYARASLDRKSTTRGCQFLGCRLISWQCKKQTVVANSTTEAEYVAASSCCGQVLWIQNQLLDYGDSNEKKLIQMIKIHTDKNVVDLLTKAFDVKIVNGEQQLQALVDGKKIVVTEASVKRDPQLDDKEGTDCLPNATIFEELTRMGAKTTTWNEFSSIMASAIICLATNQKFNFSKYIFESMVKNLDNTGKFLMYPRQGKDFSGRETSLFPSMVVQAQEEMGEGSTIPTDPHHTPIINQPSSSQPQRKQKSRSPKEKDTQAPQSSVPSDPINVADEAVNKEPRGCIQTGEEIDDIDKDAEITLVDETQGRYGDEDMFGVNNLDGDEVVVESEVTDKAGEKRNIVEEAVDVTDAVTIPVSVATITNVKLTLAQTLAELKSVRPKTKRLVMQELSESTPTISLQLPSQVEGQGSKDKGKAKMIEPENPLKKKDQIKFDKEEALRLQAKFDEEYRLAKEKAQHKRRKHFTAKRVEEKRNMPPKRAQQRSIMCTYLKNKVGWKPKNLKNKSFANIQELFDKAFKRVNTFVDFRIELVEGTEIEESSKKAEVMEESSSKRAGYELEQESAKKQLQ
ncbi:putative ribonuclease H-like domain-containing protein [Tanacetum coccineum]